MAAELASFAGQVLVDREILLQWAVPSQSNNLGWEIYRSVDQSVYERVSELVPGDGTTDCAPLRILHAVVTCDNPRCQS